MMIRRAREQQRWFYGCSRWPDCHFTFDAHQVSGAPIYHTRYGIPFRAERKRTGTGALFAAVKRNGFSLEAGRDLAKAAKKSQLMRERALKNLDRKTVETRIKAAAPQTDEEWLEFILQERVLAVQEHQNETMLRQADGLDGKKQKLIKAAAAEIIRRQRLNG